MVSSWRSTHLLTRSQFILCEYYATRQSCINEWVSKCLLFNQILTGLIKIALSPRTVWRRWNNVNMKLKTCYPEKTIMENLEDLQFVFHMSYLPDVVVLFIPAPREIVPIDHKKFDSASTTISRFCRLNSQCILILFRHVNRGWPSSKATQRAIRHLSRPFFLLTAHNIVEWVLYARCRFCNLFEVSTITYSWN
jgi:hypothetical protein